MSDEMQTSSVAFDAEVSVEENLEAEAALNPETVAAPVPEAVEETAEVEEAAPITDEAGSLEIQEQAQDVLEAAGLDLQEFTQEFTDNGNLSEDSFTKLENAGFPRALVDQYVKGSQALAAQAQTYVQDTAYGTAGGREQYEAMTEWAASNMNSSEIAAFNEAVSSMDSARAGLAISGLKAKYTEAYGTSGQTVQGTAAPIRGDMYMNKDQLYKDIQSAEYQNDSAFRDEVDRKASRTMQANGGKIPS